MNMVSRPKSLMQSARQFEWMPRDECRSVDEIFDETSNDWQNVVLVYDAGSAQELRIELEPATYRKLRQPQHEMWASNVATSVVFGGRHHTFAPAELLATRYLYPEQEFQSLFADLVEQWRDETLLLSSMSKKLLHPCYFRIIGLGRQVLPLLLRELEDRPTYWFSALEAISGENPVPSNASFNEAVESWLLWGRKNGHLL
jgi:hypothetical protein